MCNLQSSSKYIVETWNTTINIAMIITITMEHGHLNIVP
jgi:hypothetical protein